MSGCNYIRPPCQGLEVGMLAQVLHGCDFLECLNDLSLAVAWHAAQGFDGAAVQDDPAHLKERVRLSTRQER